MRRRKTAAIWLVTVLLAVTALAGCGGGRDSGNAVGTGAANSGETNASDTGKAPSEQGEQAEKLDPVTLKILLRGNRPAALDEVIAEAERRMADTLNVKLDITFVASSDHASKVQVALNSGEPYDLVFNAPWINMNQMIAAGHFTPLDDLLAQYGPNILKTRPESMWEANKVNGSVIGIPLAVSYSGGKGFLVRKDIREKIGFREIETLDDYIDFLYAVKEKESIIPLTPGSATTEGILPYIFEQSPGKYDYIQPTNVLSNLNYTLYYKNNDGIVYNLFETEEPVIMDGLKQIRQWYLDGIIHPDIMAVKNGNEVYISGKTASIVKNDFGVNPQWEADLQGNMPGAESEYINFYDFNEKRITNFQASNFIFVPKYSKNKERAIQFLNWAHEKENYDLLAYGIEGKHWEAVGDKGYRVLDNSYGWWPYLWIWNPDLNRENADLPQEIIDMNLWTQNAENYIPDILTGFSFDAAPVANEIAQLNATAVELFNPIRHGAFDFDQSWANYKEKAAPLAKAIQQELQQQIDRFLQR
jgi:putative aldouronate transport system substrate-binding protein